MNKSLAAPGLLFAGIASTLANPQGMTVSQGQAQLTLQGSTLSVQVSHNTFLSWKSFNIGAGEITRFQQPSAGSIVWNRINDANPSQIFGQLHANGIVVLANSAGFHFGPDSVVKAAGLLVTTYPGLSPEFVSGGNWQFNGLPPAASIVNYGQVEVAAGGSLHLIAHQVENHGVLSAPDGNLGLYAGKEVLVSERPDGRGLSATVVLPDGVVDNAGRLVADAGTIALHAQVVNQAGILQADSIRERNGRIEIVASDAIHLAGTSDIRAAGGVDGVSGGGNVVVKSADVLTDAVGSAINVAGGANGGDGGAVEVSAARMGSIESRIDGSASAGWRGGQLFIDPKDILLGTVGSGSAGTGTVDAGAPPDTLQLDVNTAFVGFSRISLQAQNDIKILRNTVWSLPNSTGLDAVDSRLTLQAGRNVVFESNARLSGGQYWTIDLQAGVAFSSGEVTPGAGNITLEGAAAIETGRGSILARAGNNITVGTGFIHTIGGGSISAIAQSGTINTGTRPNGFFFSPDGYSPDSQNLGGISTAAGGDVTLQAGRDIVSYLPGGVNSGHSDGGSGAFGAAPGSVSLQAGGDIIGHYVLRNGIGTIRAQGHAGRSSQLLALSLVQGTWDVRAEGEINLQEVRNPNGVFNQSEDSPYEHRFDYAPDAGVHLQAAGAVSIWGIGLPRLRNQLVKALYPPRLRIDAGLNGVILGNTALGSADASGNSLTLLPSPQGELSIQIADGGSLRSRQANKSFTLGLSDSGAAQWTSNADFSSRDHASTPVHLGNPDPVQVSVTGSIRDLVLFMPRRAEVVVGGDLINTSFVGQHLSDGDVTGIRVGGRIWNRNDYTFVAVEEPPNFDALSRAVPPFASIPFVYLPASGRLAFQGRMTSSQLQSYLNIVVPKLENGIEVVDDLGNPIYEPAVFTNAEHLQALFDGSQDVPPAGFVPEGFRLAGPGRLEIEAQSLDLGVTRGIVSIGALENKALALHADQGADLRLRIHGDIEMFASSISSLAGGAIDVRASGNMIIGSSELVRRDDIARGILATALSDVTVIATGTIDVNGSRIASYDGGNILVRSETGSVIAGQGAFGFVRLTRVKVDPISRAVLIDAATIPGSGILATTFPPVSDAPPTPAQLGDILVEAPFGDIRASAGGILQLALAGDPANVPTLRLVAGSKAPDGTVVHRGSIDASGSGVIGSDVKLEATGDIKGIILARDNIEISAKENVSVTAIAQGSVNVNAGGTVSGTLVGVGSVDASGANIDAALLSQNVSTSGSVSDSTQVGFAATAVASSAAQAASATAQQTNPDTEENKEEDEDEAKKGTGKPTLMAKTTGRVTVILPGKTK